MAKTLTDEQKTRIEEIAKDLSADAGSEKKTIDLTPATGASGDMKPSWTITWGTNV